jgi:hypothetical protein
MPPRRRSAAKSAFKRTTGLRANLYPCMHCIRTAVKEGVEDEMPTINCAYDNAASARCGQCNERKDICEPVGLFASDGATHH